MKRLKSTLADQSTTDHVPAFSDNAEGAAAASSVVEYDEVPLDLKVMLEQVGIWPVPEAVLKASARVSVLIDQKSRCILGLSLTGPDFEPVALPAYPDNLPSPTRSRGLGNVRPGTANCAQKDFL